MRSFMRVRGQVVVAAGALAACAKYDHKAATDAQVAPKVAF